MARNVEMSVDIVGLAQVKGLLGAAGDVIRAYDATRSGGAGTDLGLAVEAMRAAMWSIADGHGTDRGETTGHAAGDTSMAMAHWAMMPDQTAAGK